MQDFYREPNYQLLGNNSYKKLRENIYKIGIIMQFINRNRKKKNISNSKIV